MGVCDSHCVCLGEGSNRYLGNVQMYCASSKMSSLKALKMIIFNLNIQGGSYLHGAFIFVVWWNMQNMAIPQ